MLDEDFKLVKKAMSIKPEFIDGIHALERIKNKFEELAQHMEEKFTPTDTKSMTCSCCGEIIYPMEPPVYCYECERINNID